MCFCCEAGSRLPQPWICPVEECPYSTDVKRARSAHLLREHNLLFRGRGKDLVPLSEAELAERHEALRRRNRGSRQHARENRRTLSSSDGGGDSVAASARATSPVVGAAAVPLILLQDEEWGEAVVDVDTLLDDLSQGHAQAQEEGLPVQDAWLVVPWVPPSSPEVLLLSGGLPLVEFAERVSQWRENGLTLRQTEEAAVNLWEVSSEDLPLLRLAIQLVTSGDVVRHPRSDSAASSRGWQCVRSASVTDRDSSY